MSYKEIFEGHRGHYDKDEGLCIQMVTEVIVLTLIRLPLGPLM